MSGSNANLDDLHVKNDLFKNVRFYVSGNLEPTVSIAYSFDTDDASQVLIKIN